MNKFTQISDGVYKTNSIKTLNPIVIPENYSVECAKFAYDMTFGKVGEHKNMMSGSDRKRSDAEIFACAFQGKISEFAIYDYLKKNGVDLSVPNTDVYRKGKWDNCDLESGNDTISVKSSPEYMNFLKLNYWDYDIDGGYKYGYGKYKYDDYIAYARILPNANQKLRSSSYKIDCLINMNLLTASDLERIIAEETWKADLTGFITREEFRDEVIGDNLVINKGDQVDGLSMFSKFYYTQSGDLNDMKLLADALSDGLLDDNLDEVEELIDEYSLEDDDINNIL